MQLPSVLKNLADSVMSVPRQSHVLTECHVCIFDIKPFIGVEFDIYPAYSVIPYNTIYVHALS